METVVRVPILALQAYFMPAVHPGSGRPKLDSTIVPAWCPALCSDPKNAITKASYMHSRQARHYPCCTLVYIHIICMPLWYNNMSLFINYYVRDYFHYAPTNAGLATNGRIIGVLGKIIGEIFKNCRID